MTPPERGGWNLSAVRSQFPTLSARIEGKRLVYLDSACTALKSRRMVERLRRFYLDWAGCGGRRSAHALSQRAEAAVQQARATVARFINAEKPEEIVFTSGTTAAANLVARAFPYERRRREVVISAIEHNSLLLPFCDAARRGEIVLRFCPIRDGRPDEAALARLITSRTALVVMTHASNVLGGTLSVERATRLAHEQGAKILVDDAQYLSSHREDVRAIDVDFVVFSAHKLGGPFGVGALYGKEHLLNRLRNYEVGGGTVQDVVWRRRRPEPTFLDAPYRFEAGVRDLAGVAAFAEAVDLLTSWSAPQLRAHIRALVRRAVRRLRAFADVAIVGDPRGLEEGALVSFHCRHPRFSLRDFAVYLDDGVPGRVIAARLGEHCAHLLHRQLGLAGTARISFFAYTAPDEIDMFADALGAYLEDIS